MAAGLIFGSNPLANLDYPTGSLGGSLGSIGVLDSIDSVDYDSRDKITESVTSLGDKDDWDGAKMLMPGEKDAVPLDLQTLLKVLDQHTKEHEDAPYNSWQLVIIQGVLLSLLVGVSILWACCCKRKCFQTPAPTVHEALRKLSSSSSLKSRDFPPSYSQVDLHTLAMSVQDYLYPPPTYPEIHNRSPDDLAYLDLEGSHRQLARLSFSGRSTPTAGYYVNGSIGGGITNGNLSADSSSCNTPRTISRQQSAVSSSSSDSRKSSYSLEGISSRKSSIIKDSSSRKSSSSQDSRRSSRVSFSEAVECSNGSFRRLSGSSGGHHQTSTDTLHKTTSSGSLSSLTGTSTESSRKSSSSSETALSRKSSSSSETALSRKSSSSETALSRKLGLSQEALDKELRKKLEAIELEDIEEDRDQMEPASGSRIHSLQTVIEIEKY